MNLDSQPRFRLARLPTPLQEAGRLREALGGRLECPRILLKRDDLSDLALGGNKARKLEFLVGDAKVKGATALITTGGVQSNHARMTAAAARMAGMRSALVLTSAEATPDPQGNLLLDRVLGADVHFVGAATSKGDTTSAEDQKVAEIIRSLEASGETPYFVPLGGSNAIGTLGYVDATRELQSQLDEFGLRPTRLFYASGSRGTQAGLELGARIFNVAHKCVGIAVSGGEETKREHAARIANEAAALIGAGVRVHPEDLATDQDHYGEGYAIATHDCVEAIRLVASTEGVVLDPVYSGKAMAGMLAHIRSGTISPGETIIFLHTGGVPGFFAQARSVLGLLGAT